MHRWVAVALVAAGCATPRPVEVRSVEVVAPVANDPALEVAAAFVGAVKAGHFDAALALTSSRWRSLSPAQFKADFDTEPLAAERLARLERALVNGVTRTGALAALTLEGHPVLELVQEADGWRVARLAQ